MNYRLLFKIGAIFGVALLLLLPVVTIRELVSEREQTRDAVVAEIARSTGEAQTITGPLLVVPYTRKVRSWSEEREGVPRRLIETEVAGQLTFLPSDFELSGNLAVAERQRGIYRARIFDANSRITGAFELKANYGITTDLADYTFGAAQLALGISDIRGIGNALELRWNGERALFEPGTATALLPSGVHAKLPAADVSRPQRASYDIALSLQGTGSFQVTPMGRESRVQLSSNWPHPSFVGEHLPRERDVRQDGFDARWQTSFFATDLENVVNACQASQTQGACGALASRHFGVSFIDPVDHYLQSERATKYAFLFIGLTFAACFLLEVLRRLRVHPIQYGLVGLSLAVFFLLLLSLSEHVGFALAYAIGAVACVSLIAYYVSHVIGNTRIGALFAGALGALYALLYVILSAEDYSLLIGSLLVFGTLGVIMVLTRKVDWASFGQSQAKPASAP
ncbi:MAG: cell envelope integrity protein CreD [Polyangiaceae bacterium]